MVRMRSGRKRMKEKIEIPRLICQGLDWCWTRNSTLERTVKFSLEREEEEKIGGSKERKVLCECGQVQVFNHTTERYYHAGFGFCYSLLLIVIWPFFSSLHITVSPYLQCLQIFNSKYLNGNCDFIILYFIIVINYNKTQFLILKQQVLV